MTLDRLDAATWRDLDLGIILDHSLTPVDAAALAGFAPRFAPVFAAMAALEVGAVANPDEGRQVGHYWLRAPHLAPDGLGAVIEATVEACRAAADAVHRDGRFRTLVVLGIGGSALGPQLVADALAEPDDRLRVLFLDNTDPDGFARVLGPIDLDETLFVVISKSGGTAETRNALVEAEAACERAGVAFAERAIAVTGEGSRLWSAAEGWRARVPMWDWVGGRTSLTSAVGLLPMFLQGVDADAFLAGAAAMDERTRVADVAANPAARLAACWSTLTEERARRAMVVLPYRDRLVLLSRYLQQLVMESLGKEHDLAGAVVHQGLTVYGNKGSTDQHAYVQQLRDGPDDHFVTFVRVLDDGYHGGVEVEPGVTSGDYLHGFLLGTRRALHEQGHASLTITLSTLDAYHLGAVVALFERSVGFYASLVGINAYHQPGVEAGKRAATKVLADTSRLLAALGDTWDDVSALCHRAGDVDPDTAWHVLVRLAANEAGVEHAPGDRPSTDRFRRPGGG